MTGKPLYRLSGNIIDRKQRQGIDGLTIYAWDKDIFTWDDLLGKAVTENEGRFEIAFEWPRIRHFWTLWEDILDWRPDLYFEVYYRGKSISDFEVFYPDVAHPFRGRSVRWNVPKDVGDIKVELDGPTAKEPSAPEEFTVLGIVVEPDGQPIADLTVKAFDYDGQKETSLGDDETGTDGKYSIWYSAEQLQPEGKPWPDLIVRAYDKKGNEVASSPLHVNASAHEFIRLVMRNETYVGPSEYTVLHAKLQRLFADTDIADLTQEKIAYAAKKANLKTTSIELLVKAAQLQRKTALSAEVFYGLFREGLPSELPELLAQSPDSQRTALLAAVEKNIIPLQFGTDTAIQETLEKLKKLIVQQAFEPPPGQPQQPAPAALVATVLPEKKKQEDFIEHFITDSGSAEEFWKKLASKPGFNKDLAESVRFALQLGALTANNLPLVQKLQGMKQTGEIKALADLAQYDEKGWLELLEASTEASTSDPPPGAASNEDYAKALARKVEAAFPTAFATYRLKEDPNAKDIAIFFDKNQEYELRGSRLDSYLKGNPQKAKDTQNAIEGAGFDFEKTIKNVRTFQHLYKVTPGFKQTNALMKDGFDSAHSIARLSTKAFVDRYRKACGSLAEAVASDAVEEDAKKIYKKARQVEAMTSNLVVAFGPNIGRVGMRAVPDEAVQEVETPDGEKIPEWSTLFDSLDFCECEHCRSVYSPAAYLVDLLHFLKKRDSKVAGKNVKEILFERRPDLGDIELSCENTNTLVPYVDLVNEILEDAVVKEAEGPPRPFVPFVLSADDVESLDRGHLSDTIKNKFSANHFPLSPEETTIDVRRPGEWWRIETLRCTYTVQKEAGKQGQAAPVKVTTRSRQTSGTAEERAATPQYVNPDAYWTLRICLYPWSLPFDLHWEEVRAYLGHLGVPRHRIMEVFLPGERRAILEDPGLGLAREYLGFIPEEADILTKPYPDPPSKPKPWKLWGFEQLTLDPQHSIPDPADSTLRIASGHWLDVLGSRVDVFLQQSGLKYKELLDLLETWGAATLWGGNGGRTKSQKVFIQAPAENLDTCETSKMRLDGLSEIFAIKIVRFVRLWRKLGWTMRDLDRAITAFKEEAFQESEGKSITDQFITQLSHVQRLRNELNIPVVSLLSWWADMDTASYTDHNAPGRLQVPSLYAQLFRNRMVTNPLDPDFPEDPDDLGRGVPGAPSTPNTNNERPKLRDKTATLTAALGISAADLTLLIHEPRVIERIKNNDEEPDDKLTLSNLSKLY
ncbi:MAG: hypothetical protein KDJ22_07765, partial [Candidatus Competibacteraceae bacterium]|nr:hypothetical protein [Candidatus Competibacteraceae bacterium]